MRTAGTILALVLVQAAAAPAAAQDGFVWRYDRYLDPDPFQTRLSLAYAIPETDAIQFSATCQIGAGGTYAVVEIGADVDGLSEGAAVNVHFVGANFDHVLTGSVVGIGREVGITGVALPVELDDPLWQAMQTLPELQYSTRLFSEHRLGLSAGSGPVGQFVSDCREMPEPGAGQVATPAPPPAAPANPSPSISCSVAGSLRTASTGPAATVTFVNQADGYRSVMWIDGDGVPKPYANLNPGESYVQSTFVGHPWMITDGPGNCLEIYMPPAGQSVFTITAAGRSFGPE